MCIRDRWQKELEKKIHVLPVMWSIDPLDWATENVDEIVNKVVTEAQENDIILLHDCYDSSIKAALRIIDLLQAEGYEFVTVDELMLHLSLIHISPLSISSYTVWDPIYPAPPNTNTDILFPPFCSCFQVTYDGILRAPPPISTV